MLTRRDRTSLNGAWRFAVDPRDEGERRDWPHSPPADARQVSVPHIWQTMPDCLDYQGVAWYFTVFAAGAPVGRRVYLCFDAVDYLAMVWLNGIYLGMHEGGFTPFEFDATAALRPEGENLIAVRVFDPPDNAEIPIGKQGSWYTRVSGIWQDVYLEERPPNHIDCVLVSPEPAKGGAGLRLGLSPDFPAGTRFAYSVRPHLDAGEAFAGEFVPGSDGDAFIPLPGAILWEPDRPFLYELEVSGAGDAHRSVFGMRTIETLGGAFLLNGRHIGMRGALDQAFYPETIYRAPSEDAIREEIRLAKLMGFNLLRKHIKAELPQYLYWADRLGLLIWAEYPNYAKWTPAATARFVGQMREMIVRDYNHPSIVVWSLYNEEWGLEWYTRRDPEKQRHLAELYDRVKRLDPTRPLCDNSGWSHVKTDINDYHSYYMLPDAVEAWRRELREKILVRDGNNFAVPGADSDQPLVVSEFGNWSLPDLDELLARHGGREPWWFVNRAEETHQEDYKKPATARRNFERMGLRRIFGDFAGLSRHSVRRMRRSVKAAISDMRMTLRDVGYVVTEFTDIEWETNGWLDFFRRPKPGFDKAAEFNAALAVFADLPRRAWWGGETFCCEFVLANDDRRPVDGVLEWSLEGTALAGRVRVEKTDLAGVRLPGAAFELPAVDRPLAASLVLRFVAGETILAENREEVFVMPRRPASGRVTAHGLPGAFTAALAANGWTVSPLAGHRRGDPLVCGLLDDEAARLIRSGESALFLAERGDLLEAKGEWTFRALPTGESWVRASSFQYVDADAFPGLPLCKEVGWEADGIIPDWVVPLDDYAKEGGRGPVHMFGNHGLAGRSRILAGYFQGWIGQCGATMLETGFGKGRLFVTTWRFLDTYGRHPVGTPLLDAIVAGAGGFGIDA